MLDMPWQGNRVYVAPSHKVSLDLSDGVKVKYGKFGDLLAEVKAVTGKKKK